jgi:hypothetical protein
LIPQGLEIQTTLIVLSNSYTNPKYYFVQSGERFFAPGQEPQRRNSSAISSGERHSGARFKFI